MALASALISASRQEEASVGRKEKSSLDECDFFFFPVAFGIISFVVAVLFVFFSCIHRIRKMNKYHVKKVIAADQAASLHHMNLPSSAPQAKGSLASESEENTYSDKNGGLDKGPHVSVL